MTQGVEQM